MLFNSLPFILAFLPLTFGIYFWLLSKRLILGAKTWLVTASLFFYAYWKVSYLPLILTSIAVNFVIGSALQSSLKIARKPFLICGLLFNVGLLAYYKYTDFFITNFNALAGTQIPLQHIVLPLAISFFTFQQIAYLVDSYRGLTKEYDFLSYALFVSFFPQLIAGPIVHHKELIPQFANKKNYIRNYRNIASGVLIFLIGLFKKAVVADTLSAYVACGFASETSLNMAEGWLTSLAYTLQIYYDFSGYCDMAFGAAKLLNITLPINFNSPYKALNIQDFWRRWHITLSRFLRDYIYIPLGGNRVAAWHNYLNLFAVFFIGGLWHGASWTFIAWGTLHGLATIVHRLWSQTKIRLPKFLSWLITFNFVNITWIFFRAENFSSATKVLSAMLNFDSLRGLASYKPKFLFQNLGLRSSDMEFVIVFFIVLLLFINSNEILQKFKIKNSRQSRICGIAIGAAFILLIAKLVFVPYSEFIYFNF